MAKKLTVEVWSDVACPWCYVGKRRLEVALAQFPERASVDVVWRAFELDPSAPDVYPVTHSYADRLARKYGRTKAQAEQMLAQMTQLAASEGLTFDFSRIRSGNTFNAHRMLHLARTQGLGGALKERLFAGYFGQGEAPGDPETLLRLATDVGVDVDRAQALLSTDLYAAEVRAEQREAQAIGVSGVPFFLLGRRYGVSGAQAADVMVQALRRAWDELPELSEAQGALCGPDGCE
jgi:predicted DsbA family dithiol-disulfide isomerase